MTAVDRYNADFGSSFTSFAKPTILCELKRHLRASRSEEVLLP
jgi:DNA-directed RNA polymerase specialized sigma subunit